MTKQELLATMARLHDEVVDLDTSLHNIKDIIDVRSSQERIRHVRIILDQINKGLEAEIMKVRTGNS